MADVKTERLFQKALAATRGGKGKGVVIVHGMRKSGGITCPAAKSLEADLSISREDANKIRKLCKLADSPDELAEFIEKSFPKTEAYVRRLHSNPYNNKMWRRTVALHAMDELLDTHGVEALRDKHGDAVYDFLNTGDTYAVTLLLKLDTDRLIIGTWGDIVERNPRKFE